MSAGTFEYPAEVVQERAAEFTRLHEIARRQQDLERVLLWSRGTLATYYDGRHGWRLSLLRAGKAPIAVHGSTYGVAVDALLRVVSGGFSEGAK